MSSLPVPRSPTTSTGFSSGATLEDRLQSEEESRRFADQAFWLFKARHGYSANPTPRGLVFFHTGDEVNMSSPTRAILPTVGGIRYALFRFLGNHLWFFLFIN